MPETIREILTISVEGSPAGAALPQKDSWHDVVNALRTGKIVSGCISGIETLADGWNVVVVYYEGHRVLIPIGEMMIDLDGDGRERADTVNRQIRIANNMLGAEIDFIIRSVDEAAGSIVASRRDAMMKKRRIFYLSGKQYRHVGQEDLSGEGEGIRQKGIFVHVPKPLPEASGRCRIRKFGNTGWLGRETG